MGSRRAQIDHSDCRHLDIHAERASILVSRSYGYLSLLLAAGTVAAVNGNLLEGQTCCGLGKHLRPCHTYCAALCYGRPLVPAPDAPSRDHVVFVCVILLPPLAVARFSSCKPHPASPCDPVAALVSLPPLLPLPSCAYISGNWSPRHPIDVGKTIEFRQPSVRDTIVKLNLDLRIDQHRGEAHSYYGICSSYSDSANH